MRITFDILLTLRVSINLTHLLTYLLWTPFAMLLIYASTVFNSPFRRLQRHRVWLRCAKSWIASHCGQLCVYCESHCDMQ